MIRPISEFFLSFFIKEENNVVVNNNVQFVCKTLLRSFGAWASFVLPSTGKIYRLS